MNVSEALLKLVDLTSENVKLLEALNDSFYSKNAHIQTDIQGKKFTIPSFLSLENKINHLQDAFDNLVHSAKAGDAWMNFDGNSKEIKLVGYNPMGNPIELSIKDPNGGETKNINTKKPSFFKDMLSPSPYINFALATLPDNVSQINVRKIVLYDEALIHRIQTWGLNHGGSSDIIHLPYEDFKALIIDPANGIEMAQGTGWDMYDKVYDMDIRNQVGKGDYVIEKVLKDYIDDNLEEYIDVVISESTPMVWTSTKDAAENNLATGCKLTSYDGAAQFEITKIHIPSRTMTLRVLHGSYINLMPDTTPNDTTHSDYSILKFLTPTNEDIISKDKNLQIPLEEDQYIILYASPITPTTRVQADWSTGMFVDTYQLNVIVGNTLVGFEDYYKKNVRNIGDCLMELAGTMQSPLSNFSEDTFKELTGGDLSKPVLGDGTNATLQVVQINKHMNDSEAAKNIRSLYSQKKQYQTRLADVTNKINDLETELASVSFDDQTGTRGMYETQISELRKQYNELYSSLNHIIDSISTAANNSQIPIEAAKYRVRGYVDVAKVLDNLHVNGRNGDIGLEDIRGVHIQYRYKNPDIPQANVSVINEFLFTEWTDQFPEPRMKSVKYKEGKYTGAYDDLKESGVLDDTSNKPKFNQVDIPITQGEIVDVRARIIWAFGYPFSRCTSPWSDIYTMEFPDELVKDVQLKTIIDENNDDIETYRFTNIIRENGIDVHTQDKVQDQDITYFHKPENIASGFYTQERRIIPLRDKLSTMDKDLVELLDLVKGTTADAIKVSFTIGSNTYNITQGIDNDIHLQPYGSVKAGAIANGPYLRRLETGPVQTMGVIKITNTTKHTVNLYSMFAAPRDKAIHNIIKSRRVFDLENYYNEN